MPQEENHRRWPLFEGRRAARFAKLLWIALIANVSAKRIHPRWRWTSQSCSGTYRPLLTKNWRERTVRAEITGTMMSKFFPPPDDVIRKPRRMIFDNEVEQPAIKSTDRGNEASGAVCDHFAQFHGPPGALIIPLPNQMIWFYALKLQGSQSGQTHLKDFF